MKHEPLLLLLAVVLGSCTDRGTTHVLVVNDRTDVFSSGPWLLTREDLQHTFGFDRDIWRGAVLDLRCISSVRYGQQPQHEELPAAGPLFFEDINERKALVDRFVFNGLQLLGQSRPDSALAQSIVFRSLVDHLNELATSTADTKVALIYSDLANNEHGFTVYGKGESLWRTRPDSIGNVWTSQTKIADLSGMTVHLLHDASVDTLTPERFEVLATIAAGILRAHHATVRIGAQFVPE